MFNHINTSAVGGSAIRFFNTQMTNTVHCNQMDTCRLGVRFDASNIGDQGSAAAAQENTWYFPLTGFFAFQRDNLSPDPNWFTRNLNYTIPYTPQNSYMQPLAFVTYQLENATNDCEVPCPSCPNQRMAEIVSESGNYANLSIDEKYLLKKEVYQILDADSSYMYAGYSSDIILQDFYDSAATTNLTMFSFVNSLIQDSLSVFASAVNSWISPINHFEENEKSVNEIYLSTWAVGIYQLTQIQKDLLESVASENPLSGGDAVYTSRVMLGWDMPDFTNQINRIKFDQAFQKNDMEIKIYPNPAFEYFSVESSIDESFEISIENTVGQNIYYNSHVEPLERINTKKFSNGSYIILIKLKNTKIEYRNKLLISK
ncbi:MAG: T9SS type A sorting domain-containing protein [Bacteroidetes bacterium]|nr:T9SS type A sorting domain-containing protein [Bacteroidota bacterium]